MGCEDKTRPTKVAGAAVDAPDVSKPQELLASKQNPQDRLKSDCTPKYLFESRGKAMLRVALREKNKLKLGKLPPGEPVPPSSYDQKAQRMAQQVSELTERRRSPKNNVIFTEPVVTQQYEYEPEYGGLNKPNRSPARGSVEQEVALRSLKADPCSRDELAIEVQSYRKRSGKPSLAISSSDDDDDDELYTLAHSEDFELHASKILEQHQNKSSKRSHDSLEEPEDERMSDSPPSRSESSSGGLFSSPKVAKIAPYFDDRPGERRAAGARAILHSRYKSAHGERRSRSLFPGNGKLNGADKLHQLTRRRDSVNPRARERATELLSYKKVSSPKVNVNVISPPLPLPEPAALVAAKPVDDSDTYMESQPNGYFSWLATFLTNQMNKLIF